MGVRAWTIEGLRRLKKIPDGGVILAASSFGKEIVKFHLQLYLLSHFPELEHSKRDPLVLILRFY